MPTNTTRATATNCWRRCESEAERLNRFVGNLLDMTRLESGAIELKLDLVDIAEIVGAALQRAGSVLARHRIEVEHRRRICRCCGSTPILFEQVLFNLLDNAAKYAPAGSRIDLRARRDGDARRDRGRRRGAGHPAGRSRARLRQVLPGPGAGSPSRRHRVSGLAICRGFVEAQGGRIEARNRRDRSGAILTIRIPVPEAAEIREPVAGAWLTPTPCSSSTTSRRSVRFLRTSLARCRPSRRDRRGCRRGACGCWRPKSPMS